jgi:hypothetical protein
VTTLVFLVEDRSMKALLEGLLPRLLPDRPPVSRDPHRVTTFNPRAASTNTPRNQASSWD